MSETVPVKIAFKAYEAEGGDKEQSPIIFLHGLTASKENWGDLPQETANKTKRKVYALDARNHGDSEWTDVWSFETNIDDLLHFMDTHDITKAILVGHSMGAITSFKTAMRAPERVEKIFAEDMTVKKLSQEIFNMIILILELQKKAYADIPAGLDEKEAYAFILKHIFSNIPEEMKHFIKAKQTDDLLAMKKTEDGRYAPKANIDVLLKAAKNAQSVMDSFDGVYDGPVCIAFGKLSPFLVSDDEELIKKYFPNVEMVGLDDATHTVHSDCPEKFREILFEFLC